MTDIYKRPDLGRKAPLTPEQLKVRNLEVAKGCLTGVPVFDEMEEAGQASLIADTVEIVAYIARKHEGHYRSASPDVSYDALNLAYLKTPAQDSAFGRFRRAFGSSSHELYRTLYAMLQEGVTTKEALDAKSKPPVDPLEGIYASRTVPSGQRYDGK